MKKLRMTTYELLKFLIENHYLKGVSGHIHAFSEKPSPYGENITDEIKHLSNSYLETRGDFEVLSECSPLPDRLDTKFSIEDDKIKESICDTFEWENLDYDEWDLEEYEEGEDVIDESIYYYSEGSFDDRIFDVVVENNRNITFHDVL